MDMEEGHLVDINLLVIILDEFGKSVGVGEWDAANSVASNAVIDDDDWNVIGSDLINILGIEFIVKNDRAVNVAGDNALHGGQSFVTAVGSRE